MTVSIHIQTNHSCHEQSCVSPSSITNMNMRCNCTKPVRHNYQSSIKSLDFKKFTVSLQFLNGLKETMNVILIVIPSGKLT